MDNTEHSAPTTSPVPDVDDPATSSVLTVERTDRPRRRFTLHRSRSDAMLGGVCGGLAEELDVDPALLRIAAVTLALVTGGAAALVYLVAWILTPLEGPAV